MGSVNEDKKSHRVLLVEDQVNIRITLAALLEMENFVVVEAENGEEALRAIEEQAFDIVLSDVRMPGISGVELARRIKVLRPGTPVLLMTAYSQDKIIGEAVEEGVFAVLTKPFDPGTAAGLMNRAIKRPVILVIDDQEPVATSMAEALNLMGHSAKAVFDGQEALDVAKQGGVDLCLVDLVMPGLSGADVVERLQSIDPSILVIAMSGNSSPEMIDEVMRKGAGSFLTKPLNPATLAHSIVRAHLRSEPPAK